MEIQINYATLATDGLFSAPKHELNYENIQDIDSQPSDPQIVKVQVPNIFPNGAFVAFSCTQEGWSGRGQNDWQYSDSQGKWVSGKPSIPDDVTYLSIGATIGTNNYIQLYWCTSEEHEKKIPNEHMYILNRVPTPLKISNSPGIRHSAGYTAVPVGVLQVNDPIGDKPGMVGLIVLYYSNGSTHAEVANYVVGSTHNLTGHPSTPANFLIEGGESPASIAERVTKLEGDMSLLSNKVANIDNRLKNVEQVVGDLRSIVASVLQEISTVYVAR